MMKSAISGQEIPESEVVHAADIRRGLFEFIQKQFSGLKPDSVISISELNQNRRHYQTDLILKEKGELELLDQEVMDAIKNNKVLSEQITDLGEDKLTFGQRIADKIAVFGGSWTFIIAFFSFILLWIGINIWILTQRPFDPYPFILLNLILSCLASIQAPIIMMSQNRQEQKDRQRGEQDYKVNLKAELEIQLLNEKIDHLIVHQNRRLLEIQELQTDYLEDLINRLRAK